MSRTMGREATPSSSSATLTLTDTPSDTTSSRLILKLKPKKKTVRWKEGTVDNEFMNKKSSKKCCIFHKDKPFDEDSSDDEDQDNNNKHKKHDHHDHACYSQSV